MSFKLYPQIQDGKKVGFTVEEILNGTYALYMDVTCPRCGKEQSVAQTGSIGGPCICCGIRTDGATQDNSILNDLKL